MKAPARATRHHRPRSASRPTSARPVPRSVRVGVGLLSAAYVALFTWVTLTRTGAFTPDSMNYVDVARHVAQGDGFVQSTLGFNQARFAIADSIPTPFTSQAPLYPLLLAAAIRAGAPPAGTALSLAIAFYFATITVGVLLARGAFGPAAAWLAGALLLVLEPLHRAGTVAWSDTLGLAASGAALVLLLRARPPSAPLAAALAAGLAAGTAFAARYPLAPLALVGVVALRARLAAASAFAGGWLAVALPVLLRTHLADGTWLGPARNPSTIGFEHNVRDAVSSLLGEWAGAPAIPRALQVVAACAVVAAAVLTLVRRGALRKCVFASGRVALPLWALAYLVTLVVERTRTHFDPIDARLVLPGAVPLVVVAAGLVAAAFPRVAQARHAALLVLACLAWGVTRESLAATRTRARSVADDITRSPRLTWIASHATARDLILGDDVVDVPFYFPGRRALSFSLYPYTDRPTYQSLVGYTRAHCDEYERVFLLLRLTFPAERQWRQAYGPFITALAFADSVRDAGIRRVERLDDAFVFQVECPRPGGPARP